MQADLARKWTDPKTLTLNSKGTEEETQIEFGKKQKPEKK